MHKSGMRLCIRVESMKPTDFSSVLQELWPQSDIQAQSYSGSLWGKIMGTTVYCFKHHSQMVKRAECDHPDCVVAHVLDE